MRVSFKVSGQVQGVGFRWFVRDAAARLGVTGWVANRRDGTVRGEAQADGNTLDGFFRELKGPDSPGDVAGVELSGLDERPGEGDFSIAPTD